jgi:glycosyltransferase involved in cell wall biosynthesis/SAM-dependent methyltransferase
MVEWNAANGIFKVPFPERSMEFTGERMTTAIEGEIEFEHFHRYCLARDLCPGLDLVDVASGEGYGSSILATVARSVTGVDVDPAAIAHAGTTYTAENLRFIKGSALDLPLGDASVDAVVSFETLEHVREHARFMAEVKRVLRPGGKLIVSTPERAVYSARGEPVNKYHLLELTAAEFDSLLRVNFRHVLILSQRAILGSLIIAAEGGGPWRSYERRSLEYIEASAGLTRAPFLVAIASDEKLSQVPSSVYLDRRRPGEVIGGYLQLPVYQSQAAEMSAEIKRLSDAAAIRDAEVDRLSDIAATRDAEIDRLSDIAATRDAEIGRLSDVAVTLDAEIKRLGDAKASRDLAICGLKRALSARDIDLSNAKGECDAKIAWFNDELARLTGHLETHAAEFAGLQGRFDKLTQSLRWRLFDNVVHLPRAVGRFVRWPVVRIAFHKSGRPRGWLRGLGFKSGPIQTEGAIARISGERALLGVQSAAGTSGEGTLLVEQGAPSVCLEKAPAAPDMSVRVFDPQKKTILIVSHDASRTGAPILALNLVQRFSERYNVIGLILGSGELIDHFRQASASLLVADRVHMTDGELDRVITVITSRHPLSFAITNTVESRRVLKPLKVAGIPTISLIHEFSANTRPRSALPDVLSLSTRTVFSTKTTLDDVVSDFFLYPSSSIHIEPQGKCVVPASPDAAEETSIEKTWLTRNLRPPGVRRKFLVIGVGTIGLRKGVDLFLDCATIVKNEPGGERFQFVWIGDDPYEETVYSLSLFLTDQIKRAGLESQMKIVRSTSQIELAYQISDLLIISSRLDPLPNVATEALTSGLPVLCFEKTTGIANFLSENGLGGQCVAKYLDTRDLARKVRALADDDDLRAKVSERSRAAAESAFDMSAYVSKIEAIAVQAMGNESRVRQEVRSISKSGRFRSDFFKHVGVENLSEEKIIEDYLDRVACGLGIRKPMPGFHPTVFSMLHTSEGSARQDPFVEFLQNGLPDGPWLQSVIQDCHQREVRTRAALHLHAFYPELVPGIVKRLNFNASTPDLFISVATPEGAAEAREALSGYRGRLCDLQVTPNLGRDFGPLLTQFGRSLCGDYEIIGHLHTKKSVHVADRPSAEAWTTFLLENLIGGERGGAMLDAILSAMELDSRIGLVFPDDPHVMSWTQNGRIAEDLAARMKLGDLPEQFNFPIGSMFWVRSSVLSRFIELDLAWGDYPPEPIPIDGTIVHAIERLFGVVPATMGMNCVVTNVPGLTR